MIYIGLYKPGRSGHRRIQRTRTRGTFLLPGMKMWIKIIFGHSEHVDRSFSNYIWLPVMKMWIDLFFVKLYFDLFQIIFGHV